MLLSIQGGSDLGLFEINEAARLVPEAAHPEANIIFGAVIDDALGDEVRVTVIAAGFDGGVPAQRKDDRALGQVAGPRRPAPSGWRRRPPRPTATDGRRHHGASQRPDAPAGARGDAEPAARSGWSSRSAPVAGEEPPEVPDSLEPVRARAPRRSSSTTPMTSWTCPTSSSRAVRQTGAVIAWTERLDVATGRPAPVRELGTHRPASGGRSTGPYSASDGRGASTSAATSGTTPSGGQPTGRLAAAVGPASTTW